MSDGHFRQWLQSLTGLLWSTCWQSLSAGLKHQCCLKARTLPPRVLQYQNLETSFLPLGWKFNKTLHRHSRRVQTAMAALWRHRDRGVYQQISCMGQFTVSFYRRKTAKNKQREAEREAGRLLESKKTLISRYGANRWSIFLIISYRIHFTVRKKKIIDLILHKYGWS